MNNSMRCLAISLVLAVIATALFAYTDFGVDGAVIGGAFAIIGGLLGRHRAATPPPSTSSPR